MVEPPAMMGILWISNGLFKTNYDDNNRDSTI